jgi:hypothetical protein
MSFKVRSKEKEVKALILHDTWIEGTPVYAGDTHDIAESTFLHLKSLKRAVEERFATKENHAAIKQFKTRFDVTAPAKEKVLA